MTRLPDFLLGVRTVTKTRTGIVLDGYVAKWVGNDSIDVKVLVPTDGSTPQILHHAPRIGVLPSHDVLELCSHAVNHAHHWLSTHKLLEQHDLTSANDWHFDGTFWEQECAFRSPSLDVLATFDRTSGGFASFVGCMVRQGKVYRYPSERLGALLFAKIVMAIARRARPPRPDDFGS